MGRTKPASRISDDRRREVDLARAVDEAMNRLAVVEAIPVGADAAAIAATSDAAVEAFVTDLDAVLGAGGNGNGSGNGNGAAAIVPIPRPFPPIRLNLVTLDGIEVTQEVQDVGHSVPLVAGKATIVRVYLKFPTPA